MDKHPTSPISFLCRGCGSTNVDSLLELEGFPSAAQYFLESLDQAPDDKSVTLSVAECQDCGLVQLENTPVSYYRDVITAAALSTKSKESLISEWAPLISRFDLIGKEAIEIGACRGDFVSVLVGLGLRACGLEHSLDSVTTARAKGLDVREGYLIGSNLKGKFDLVVCNNYLEHQPDVKTFVKELRKLVAEDGLLYVSVPNLDYLLKRSCLYEFVADHLVYFREQSLRALFESNGFSVQMQYEKNQGNDLVLIAKKTSKLNLQVHRTEAELVIQSLRRLLANASASRKTVVSWGAGHRALALLALAEARTISFVVDSAPYKQDLFTPITHIPIKSPNYLYQQGCDLLILMLPGSLALQVRAQLIEFKCNYKVIVFDDSVIDVDMFKETLVGNK